MGTKEEVETTQRVVLLKMASTPSGTLSSYLYGQVIDDEGGVLIIKNVLRRYETEQTNYVPAQAEDGSVSNVPRVGYKLGPFMIDGLFTNAEKIEVCETSYALRRELEEGTEDYDQFIEAIDEYKTKLAEQKAMAEVSKIKEAKQNRAERRKAGKKEDTQEANH